MVQPALKHEIANCSGTEFIVRQGTVDRQSVDWLLTSPFVATMRATALSESDAVLDLGAHIGAFALITAFEKPCTVVGCEPDAASLRLARANGLLNQLEDRVHFHPYAIAGHEGTAVLYETTETWGHTLVEGGGPDNQPTGRTVAVPVLGLEGALNILGGRRCGLAKFNIEGAEHAMFRTASPDALRSITTYVGEIHDDLGDGDTAQVARKFGDCGFEVELQPCGENRAILIARSRQP